MEPTDSNARGGHPGRGTTDAGSDLATVAHPVIEPGIINHQRRRHAAKITGTWRKSLENVLETGRLLAAAKAQLPHGEFEAMVEADLPFSPRTARVLMLVARNAVLADRQHVAVLPASWGTLGELARLPGPVLVEAIAAGKITPRMERAQVAELRTRALPSQDLERSRPGGELPVQTSLSETTTGLTVPAGAPGGSPDEPLPFPFGPWVEAAAVSGCRRAPKKALKKLWRVIYKLREDLNREFTQFAEYAPFRGLLDEYQSHLSDMLHAESAAKTAKAADAERAARAASPPERWECPSCGEITDASENDLVVIRQCSNEDCNAIFNGDEHGQACPECNRTFSRRLHDLGCPACGENEEECTEVAEAVQP